ncbi:glycosyltransferase [Pseudacidobacterium ailaaui]|jgi:rhamnosyltransferase|uniref:glycosyltransferase n=1 Tax=Pseudacidobacterium ailaaui TaxID=1382359 RepID=UPI000679BBBB|nr:glycosyltransferase [Pseudacidobacterium ailaaui]MBX6359023.1 glycosyltransferase [Pseudacidobacterium ailaaui]
MNRAGLIFVLYEPTQKFLLNLERASADCTNLVVVDNSPYVDTQLHLALQKRGLPLIYNQNRGGLAGAYNRGMEVLLQQGCDVVFLLDQDSEIESSFFDKMMQACNALGDDEFLLGPKIYEINLQRCMPIFQPARPLPHRVRIDDREEGLFPSLCIISSGSAISASAYRKLGPFREDYFIEYVDIEYCLRAAEQGIPVYVNASVTLRQTTGNIERHGKRYTTNHSAWRRYYGARNAVHCLRLHRKQWGLHWVSAFLAYLQILRVLQYEPQKLRKTVAILVGYVDGLLGSLGTFEERHPAVAAFCKAQRRKVVLKSGPTVNIAGGFNEAEALSHRTHD